MSKLIYLDNSATSFPKPDVVYEFMHDFYRSHGVNPGRSGFDAALETEEMVTATRKMLTTLFNGGHDHDRLTFSYNATDSLNLILLGLAEDGDHVVTTMLEHNSVLRPLHHMEQDGRIQVTHVPFDGAGYVDPDDIRAAIRPTTRMVVVNHCSNVIGTVQPVAEIGRICRDAGVLLVVDGSQSAGAIPVDMRAMNIDAFIFTGHKCLMGPTGIGGSYVREGVEIRHTRYGGTGVRSAHPRHLDEYPYRLEYGTLNLVGVAGLHAGVRWVLEQGIENLHAREMALWARLRDGISTIDGTTTYCAHSGTDRNPVLSFNIDGFEAGDVGTLLDVDYDIACRTGLQCAPLVHRHLGTEAIHGTVRLSIGPFTTDDHITAAIDAVADIAPLSARRRVAALT